MPPDPSHPTSLSRLSAGRAPGRGTGRVPLSSTSFGFRLASLRLSSSRLAAAAAAAASHPAHLALALEGVSAYVAPPGTPAGGPPSDLVVHPFGAAARLVPRRRRPGVSKVAPPAPARRPTPLSSSTSTSTSTSTPESRSPLRAASPLQQPRPLQQPLAPLIQGGGGGGGDLRWEVDAEIATSAPSGGASTSTTPPAPPPVAPGVAVTITLEQAREIAALADALAMLGAWRLSLSARLYEGCFAC